MSKSKKNVVSPEAILEKYGADTARLFMLSDSPPERDLDWSDTGIEGASRFLHRLWKMAEECKSQKPQAENQKISKLTHKTIAAVTEHIEKFQLNSAVAKIRELFNAIQNASLESQQAFKVMLQLLYPMTPHIAEEIWESLGHKTPLAKTPWPIADKSLLTDDLVTIAIQVNGKLKSTLELPINAPEEVVREQALAFSAVKIAVGDKPLRKVIYVPNRILNVVV